MFDELHALVDALSDELGRPVLLDDALLRPLAYSRQWGSIDAVRSSSILSRGASAAVREALFAQGIADADGPQRTAPVAALAMEARICVPVRRDGALLAFLWLLDPDESLSAAALERAAEVAERAGGLLAAQLPTHGALRDDPALVAALCGADPARALATWGLPEGPFVLWQIGPRRGGEFDRAAALRRLGRRLSPDHALAGGERREELILLVSLADPALGALRREELPARVLRALGERGEEAPAKGETSAPMRRADRVAGRPAGDEAAASGRSAPLDAAVGQSGELARPADAARGLRQAALALRVARSRSAGEAHAAWDALAADRLVGQLPAAALDDVPAPLAELIAHEPVLAATLAAYLDVAGDVPATAARLGLNRSGVYYRLRRIEQLAEVDLRRGDDRLLAHLALRLSGLNTD